jgi:two-component system, NarL family, sensor kinase
MIRTLLCPVIVLLLLFANCTSKNFDAKEAANNDSIKKYLDLAGDDLLSVKLRSEFNDKAFSLIDLTRNDTVTRFYLSSLSVNYLKFKEFKKYKNVAKFHIEKSNNAKDTLNIVKYYWYKASCFMYNGIKDSAYYYYIKAEKLHRNIKISSSLANIKFNKGILQFKIGDYTKAELSLLQAYCIYKDTNENQHKYGTLNQLGLVYNMLNDYKKSLFYHKMALESVRKYNLKDKKLKESVCYNNIGYLYLNQKQYSKAIENFELGLRYKNIINEDEELYALLKSNLAYSKFKSKNTTEAFKLLLDALLIEDKIKGLPVLTNIYLHLSEYYESKGQSNLALFYCKKGLREAKSSRAVESNLAALYQAIIIDKDKSKDYLEKYSNIIYNFQLEERKSKEHFDKIQLEVNEITQQKDKAISQKWFFLGVSTCVVLIILLIFVINHQRTKQKELRLQQEQQKANEEIYYLMLTQKTKEDAARQNEKRRIARDLHDGVMNRLASTRLNLDVLHHKKDDQTIKECLTYIREIYKIEQEIRNISHDLALEIFNPGNSFVVLINDFITAQNNTFNTQYKLEIEGSISWDEIPSSTKLNLFRIIQEGCHNINKFAQAKNTIISLLLDDRSICLSITDDGKGFDIDANTEGIGLKNIKQRVESLSGKFTIQSIKNKSTSLNIKIPII